MMYKTIAYLHSNKKLKPNQSSNPKPQSSKLTSEDLELLKKLMTLPQRNAPTCPLSETNKYEKRSQIIKFVNNWNGDFDLYGPSDELNEFYDSLYTSLHEDFKGNFRSINEIGYQRHKEFRDSLKDWLNYTIAKKILLKNKKSKLLLAFWLKNSKIKIKRLDYLLDLAKNYKIKTVDLISCIDDELWDSYEFVEDILFNCEFCFRFNYSAESTLKKIAKGKSDFFKNFENLKKLISRSPKFLQLLPTHLNDHHTGGNLMSKCYELVLFYPNEHHKKCSKILYEFKKKLPEGFNDAVIKKLSQCPLLLKHIKCEDKTEEMIRSTIIALDWRQLQIMQNYIPVKLKKSDQRAPVPYLKSYGFLNETLRQSVNALYFWEPAAQETLANNYIEVNRDLLQFASQEKKHDKKIVMAAVQQNGMALQWATETLRNDKDIVMVAVNQNGMALQWATETLRNNKDIVMVAVNQNGMALQWATELKNDKDIVMKAIQQDGFALTWASKKFKKDINIVMEAIQQNGLALTVASEESKQNPILELLAHSKVTSTKDLYCHDDDLLNRIKNKITPQILNDLNIAHLIIESLLQHESLNPSPQLPIDHKKLLLGQINGFLFGEVFENTTFVCNAVKLLKKICNQLQT